MSNDIQKMSQDFQHRVREAAYFMWEAAGRPLGSAMQFWVEAEQQVFKTMQVAAEAMMPSARNEPAEKPAKMAEKPAETAEKPSKKSAQPTEPKKPAKTAASGKKTGNTEKSSKAAASGASGDKKQRAKPDAKTAPKPAGKTKKGATTKKP